MTGRIIGTGSYVPDNVWDNHKIAEMVETSDEWIRERTGIVKRHIAETEDTVYMAVESAKNALNNSGLSPSDIDLIIVCTLTPDQLMPCIACEVQKELKAVNAFCFDMNAACSGFIFAYNTALAYMIAGTVKNAIIVGAEKLSNIVDWNDRGTCILFGDGAGAVVVSSDSSDDNHFVMHSDGEGGEALLCKSGQKMTMDGQQVFKFAVRKVPECVEELLNKVGKKTNEIDLFILHQANRRIVESVAKRLGVDIDKFPINLDEYGNTSSASIPILLDELNKKGKLKRNSKIVMAGFGAGLSWGAAYFEW